MNTTDEPYGDFLTHDPECPRVRELERERGQPMTDAEAARHRQICERCMLLAVLSSEIL